MATGAHPVNLLRARYLLPDSLLAVYAGIATSEKAPEWMRSLARGQFLDGMYARELVRVLDETPLMTRALLYCAGGGIGDSLVASVVGRALHARFEQVDALTLPGHRSTLERVPDLDGVLVDDGGDEGALGALLKTVAMTRAL